jgi:hypothetical protein
LLLEEWEKVIRAPELNPEKITHPFQLMAAWFVMLILLVGTLLTAAVRIDKPTWAPGFLVVSAVVLSMAVMAVVFTMLTRFRPHLQGPKEYAAWLKDERRFSFETLRTVEIRETSVATAVVTGEAHVEIANEQIGSRRFLTGVQQDREELEAGCSVVGNEIADACQYPVWVSNIRRTGPVLVALRELGFKADVYRLDSSRPNDGEPLDNAPAHAAIWIGSRVPPRIAVPAIKRVAEIWHHLRFLHLSVDGGNPPDEIHDQLYFGGSTSTAVEYGLLRWTPKELRRLPEDVSIEDFHKVVRAKYGTANKATMPIE